MKLKLALIVLTLCLFNCKQETAQKQEQIDFDFKYPSAQKLLDCDNLDTSLFQEAMQSFENDIVKFYTPDQPVYSRAYSIFVGQAIGNKADYSKLVSEHSKTVFEVLKQDKRLWIDNADDSKVNFQHPIFKCIGANIKDEPLRKTYNALIDTNSMSMRMFGGQLRRKTFDMKDDKYLATFVALELFYGKFFDIDFNAETSTENEASTASEKHDAHDGHNH